MINENNNKNKTNKRKSKKKGKVILKNQLSNGRHLAAFLYKKTKTTNLPRNA